MEQSPLITNIIGQILKFENDPRALEEEKFVPIKTEIPKPASVIPAFQPYHPPALHNPFIR